MGGPRCRAADGCVTTDPLFANASAGDYGLTVASPCKDTGAVESWMADAYDLAGGRASSAPRRTWAASSARIRSARCCSSSNTVPLNASAAPIWRHAQYTRAHLRHLPPSLLKIGNNYLKQLAFGARANSPAPICRSSNWHDSECSRCARRTMLFLKVVLVVSKSQYAWVKNGDAGFWVGFRVY